MELTQKTFETDVLVVGTEGAGATAAIEAVNQGVSVIAVTKGHKIGQSGATVTGDASIAVDGKSLCEYFNVPDADPTDSFEIMFEDIIRGGKFLNNQKLVEIDVLEAPERLKDLVNWGMKIGSSKISSGHRKSRNLHIPGSGTTVTKALTNAMRRLRIPVVEDTMITDLLTHQGRVVGALGLDFGTGGFVVFKAKATVLTTGGILRLYPITTATDELTGDGQAMAYRVGAELVDMEFPMFLPGGLVWPPAVRGVDVPFILCTSGNVNSHMYNKWGERFMLKVPGLREGGHPEHRTRDLCSVGMYKEIIEGKGSPRGGVYVSLRHLPENLIDNLQNEKRLRDTYLRYGGFHMEEFLPDLRKNAMEAVPASHFTNGGIRINESCETNVPGLFAAGEVTGGVHGANRIANNAYTEMVVFGHRSGRFAAEYAKKAPEPAIDPKQVKEAVGRLLQPIEREGGIKPIEMKNRIQKLAWEKVGVIRDGKILEESLREIEETKNIIPKLYTTSKDPVYNREWVEALQVENMLLCLEMVARAGLMRTESRGAHYRKDYPNTDYINWTKNIIVRQVEGKMAFRTEPAIITKLKPPEKVTPYGVAE